jgi:hypothetical protein
MASHPALLTSVMTAADVARGVSRMLLRHDYVCLCEVPLANGRRADLMGVDARGRIVIVEIKVSRADLLGDGKWPDYLDYCDRFFWAVPQGFDLAPFESEALRPDVAGLIVADRYDAATLDFARRAARRLLGHLDPECESLG